jgi:hypothetical protein
LIDEISTAAGDYVSDLCNRFSDRKEEYIQTMAYLFYSVKP